MGSCWQFEHEDEQHCGCCCRFYIPVWHNRAVECVSMTVAAQWYFRVALKVTGFELFLKLVLIAWQACIFFFFLMLTYLTRPRSVRNFLWRKMTEQVLMPIFTLWRYNRLIQVTCFVCKIREIGRYCLFKRDKRWACLLAPSALSMNCLKETTFKLFISKIRAARSERELNAIGATLQLCMFPAH